MNDAEKIANLRAAIRGAEANPEANQELLAYHRRCLSALEIK